MAVLRSVSTDPDADVRAYARRALAIGGAATEVTPPGSDADDGTAIVVSS